MDFAHAEQLSTVLLEMGLAQGLQNCTTNGGSCGYNGFAAAGKPVRAQPGQANAAATTETFIDRGCFMRCEVIAVGTELLLGQIVDTNSAWIGEQLALAGINSHFQTKVGDNMERLLAALSIALERSDAVILCGGLGPTQDDLTREAIARFMGVPLVRDETLVARIRDLFHARGRDMSANNLRQADVPQGAAPIPQMPGTAPGLLCPVGAKVIYAVPGVPYEMQEMVSGTVLPDLQRRAGVTAVIQSRVLRTWGQAESGLAEMLAERIQALDQAGNPTLAFLASGIEGIKVRITAKAPDTGTAKQMLTEEEGRVRAVLGDLVFGVDDENMETVILNLLRARGMTLAVAETLTGGLMSSRLSAVAGANDILRGGVVLWQAAAATELFALPAQPLLSEAAVEALALGVAQRFGATVGVASAGVADPSEQRDDLRVGTAILGVAIDGETVTHRVRLPGRRAQLAQFTVISLLSFLRLRLLGRMSA